VLFIRNFRYYFNRYVLLKSHEIQRVYITENKHHCTATCTYQTYLLLQQLVPDQTEYWYLENVTLVVLTIDLSNNMDNVGVKISLKGCFEGNTTLFYMLYFVCLYRPFDKSFELLLITVLTTRNENDIRNNNNPTSHKELNTTSKIHTKYYISSINQNIA